MASEEGHTKEWSCGYMGVSSCFSIIFRFLMTRYINKPANFMGVVERDFFAVSRYGEHISFIQAIDLHQNANEAGFASIIYGGIGDRYVIIRIKSARGYSLKYNLQVLGQK